MTISLTLPAILGMALGFFLFMACMMIVSCAYIQHEIEKVKDNKVFKIYWSLNVALQIVFVCVALLATVSLHLYLKP
jgi:hypothetical protein